MRIDFRRFLHKMLTTLAAAIFPLTSCTEFTNVGAPNTQLIQDAVFSNDQAADAAMAGIYSRMVAGAGFASGGGQSITVLAGLSSDELVTYSSGENLQFESNQLIPENSRLRQALWSEPYRIIYTCNAMLDGLARSQQISENTKTKLTGDAKFIRAFCYFYLVNMFGDVPLHLTTNYRTNSVRQRTPVAEVYAQILDDLLEAEKLLKDSSSVGNRTRPSSWTAAALLARTYLYLGEWEQAEFWASSILNNALYAMEADLKRVFLMDSKATIWQLAPVEPGRNTNEGNHFIHTVSPASKASGEVLNGNLLAAFEIGDLRKMHWIGAIADESDTLYFPFKYKIGLTGQPVQEYSIVFRIEEQLLIRAEANVHRGYLTEAITDLNAIRARAGLPLLLNNIHGSSTTHLLSLIFEERRRELFTEWGHRWFDLRRSGRIDSIMSAANPVWKPTASLYPVPATELQNNVNSIQNPGY